MTKSLVVKLAVSPQHSPELYASLIAISDPRTRTAMLRVWAEAGLGRASPLSTTRDRYPGLERDRATHADPEPIAAGPRTSAAMAPVSLPANAGADLHNSNATDGLHPSLAGLDIDALGAAVGEYGG